MEKGRGGNNGVGENPFRTGAQNAQAIEPAQAEDGAIVSTDETRNADYASDFEQRLNQQDQGQSRRRILVIVAAALGILAVIAIGVLLIRTMDFGANAARRQNIAQLQSEVNSLINLVTNGEYSAESSGNDSDEDGDLYMQRIIDASRNNKAKDRESFFTDLKKSLKNIDNQVKENGANIGLGDVKYHRDAVSEIKTVVDVLEAYAEVDYNDMNNFVEDFAQNGKAGVEDRLLNDMFSMASVAKEKLAETEEGQAFTLQAEDNYKEVLDYVSSKNEILTFVYYMNLDYAAKASAILNLYQEGGCIQDSSLDEACRLGVDNTEAGVQANKELIDTTEFIKENMNDWCESILRSMNNLKKELEEANK